jgi:plastocyanin
LTPTFISGRAFVPLAPLAIAAVLVLSFACGGGGGTGETPGTTRYEVTMTDTGNIPNDYSVAAGSTLTLHFVNIGTSDHNVRTAGGDNQYNTSDDAVSVPDRITARGTGTLTWTAPSKPGEYLFKCDFHPDLKGTITVK